jgi:4-hydroxybenzoate polyprenyltransferase
MTINPKVIIKLIRPHQYIKNLFIFMPMFFVGKINDVDLLLSAFIAFLAFSATASAIYILNDYLDINEDRQHPKKKNRPLASGAITKEAAIYLIGIFIFIGFILMSGLSLKATAILGLYVVLNIGYSFYLKHIAILDVTIIAIGFVLRILVGAAATGITPSMWIIIMTFLLALFLALAKRQKMRKVIDGYNLQLIDSAMSIMASVVIVAYILYTTSSSVAQRLHSEYIYFTALFVILGIMRYLQITFVENDSGSPTMLILKDKFIQFTVVGWASTFAWIIYI